MWDEIKRGSKWSKTYQCDGADNEEMWERRARVLREKPRYVSQRNPNTGGLGYAVIEKNNFHEKCLNRFTIIASSGLYPEMKNPAGEWCLWTMVLT